MIYTYLATVASCLQQQQEILMFVGSKWLKE